MLLHDSPGSGWAHESFLVNTHTCTRLAPAQLDQTAARVHEQYRRVSLAKDYNASSKPHLGGDLIEQPVFLARGCPPPRYRCCGKQANKQSFHVHIIIDYVHGKLLT